MLTEAVRSVVEGLVAALPGITAVWLIGSRASGTARHDSDWDLIVMIDTEVGAATLDAINRDLDLKRRCAELSIDLLVVHDGDNFVEPWGTAERVKHGSLSSWHWQETTTRTASYRASKCGPDGRRRSGFGTGRRVWPT